MSNKTYSGQQSLVNVLKASGLALSIFTIFFLGFVVIFVLIITGFALLYLPVTSIDMACIILMIPPVLNLFFLEPIYSEIYAKIVKPICNKFKTFDRIFNLISEHFDNRIYNFWVFISLVILLGYFITKGAPNVGGISDLLFYGIIALLTCEIVPLLLIIIKKVMK